MKRLLVTGAWIAIALGGALALGKIALYRGEAISATWFVVAAICCYLVAYRLYSAFIAAKSREGTSSGIFAVARPFHGYNADCGNARLKGSGVSGQGSAEEV